MKAQIFHLFVRIVSHQYMRVAESTKNHPTQYMILVQEETTQRFVLIERSA